MSKSLMIFLTIIAGSSLSSLVPVAFAQDDAGSAASLPTDVNKAYVSVVAEFKEWEGFPNAFRLTWNAGVLQPGKNYHLKLAMVNSGDRPIVFDRIVAGCGCVKLLVRQGMVPPAGSETIEVELKTPESAKNSRIDIDLEMTVGEGATFVCLGQIQATISGNLHVEQGVHAFDIGDSITDFQVPISISAPLKVEDLLIEKSASLDSVSAEVVAGGQITNLLLLVHPDLVSGESVAGQIRITDPASERTAVLDCVFTKRLPIRISPGLIFFTRSVDDRRGEAGSDTSEPHVTGTALLAIDPGILPANEAVHNEGVIPAPANESFIRKVLPSIDGQPLNAKTVELGKRHVRLDLCFPASVLSDRKSGDVKWHIELEDGRIFALNTLWRILR